MIEPRIISLLPSGTEIVAALGLGVHLVGRSHECDYPPEVESLPVCSEPKYHSDGPSPEINKAVRDILEGALSIYTIDIDLIKSLKPTHIITQSLCEVCAVSTGELQEALNEFATTESVSIIDLNPGDDGPIYADVLNLASSLNVEEAGQRVFESMQGSFRKIMDKTQSFDGPRVAHIEWIEPLMVTGHWTYDLIDLLGAFNCFQSDMERWISFKDLVKADPEIIVIAPCGFGIERSQEDMHLLTKNTEWEWLLAVVCDRVYIADGHQYFNRSGPRLVDSAEILAEIYYPELERKHEGTGWVKFEGK
ncbi:MAG: ABC transporter substrate-binding protein [Flavobacteriales bacterium]|nr:ABC transporter substrate-binding protein [Flavobacteriales bacterium]